MAQIQTADSFQVKEALSKASGALSLAIGGKRPELSFGAGKRLVAGAMVFSLGLGLMAYNKHSHLQLPI